ncbi:MAG: sigma 54-interacting transcriptional regulator [Deltaproteobacteria bacterium]|jgi:DNA-binding NtrC family response regulator
MADVTVPHRPFEVSVHGLEVEVVRGPDTGKTVRADEDTITVGGADGNNLVLQDDTVSRYHLELKNVGDRILVVDLGSTNGTSAQGVHIERASVAPGTVLTVGKTALRVDSRAPAKVELLDGDRLGDLRGVSPVMRKLMSRLLRVAQSDVSVLLIGDTGVGKEVTARAIHDASPRKDQPFETVDCGSLSPTLIASELFGHEKGAFTGATQQHAGAFERADGGTLFLDEIGELPSALQPNLLGALERRSFRRVGGQEPVRVNVRVLCATNRDLRREVNKGRFRSDLYYRIAVVLLLIPPLRDRPEDIELLVEHFLREAGHSGPVEDIVPEAAMEALEQHTWPGNVRELRNFVEAALAMGEMPALMDDPEMTPPEDSVPSARSHFPTKPLDELYRMTYKDARSAIVDEFEGMYLRVLLERCRENVSKAARESDIHRSYLTQMLKRHGLR